VLSILEFETKRQRTIKYNKLRGRNLTVSPTMRNIRKSINKTTKFKNPLKEKIRRFKYKAKKGLV